MSILLGPIFAYPLHPQSWPRPRGSIDYRVTNTFDGPDYLNGGKHRAVDVGNFRRGDSLHAPLNCVAHGLRHTDGALGVRFSLGFGMTLELWHLDRVDVPSNGAVVRQGQVVGATGATGARLPNGQPMPAHTHVAMKRDGEPFDPEPHLFGAPIPTSEEMDMPIYTKPVREAWDVPAGTVFYTGGPELGARKSFTAPAILWSNGETLDGNWRRIEYGDEELWMDGNSRTRSIRAIPGTRNPVTGYGSPSVDCSPQETRIARARTALIGAGQALTAAKEALG